MLRQRQFGASSRTDTTAAWKKSHFILSEWLDFHEIDNVSIAVYAFAWCILMSLSGDEMQLPSYENLSINFRDLSFKVEISHFFYQNTCILFCLNYVEANATCCLL